MRRTLIAALLLCLASTVVHAQQHESPAVRQLRGWLAAFDDERHEALQQFVEQNVAPASRQRLLSASPNTFDFRARTGGFDFRKIESSTPTHLSALVQERGSDQFARLVMDVEAAAPYRLTSLSLDAVPRPAEFAIARTSDSAVVAQLRPMLERDAAAGRFAGAVLVARDGRTVFQGAYGLADRERGVANSVNTRFRIGSMNKMFTAVAVLQLVQAGRLRLDAPLGTYLTDYPNKDVASKVTIRHLLTHTGGTGDIFGPEFESHRTSLRTIGDYVHLYGARGLAFAPGARWEYSNYGFVLLGAVIERVSGTSYYDYVATHVYAPAGMTSTGSLPEDSAVADRSLGYMRDRATGALTSNAETLPYRGSSAGGGYSTVGDLARFAVALKEHRLLNAAYTDSLTTGKVEAGMGGRYAFGFIDRVEGGARFYGHGGGAPGMNGDLEIDPRSGYVVAVLSNLDPPAAQRVSQFLTARLPIGAPVP